MPEDEGLDQTPRNETTADHPEEQDRRSPEEKDPSRFHIHLWKKAGVPEVCLEVLPDFFTNPNDLSKAAVAVLVAAYNMSVELVKNSGGQLVPMMQWAANIMNAALSRIQKDQAGRIIVPGGPVPPAPKGPQGIIPGGH